MYELGTAVEQHIVCDDVMKVVRKRKYVMEKLTDVETAVHSFIPSYINF